MIIFFYLDEEEIPHIRISIYEFSSPIHKRLIGDSIGVLSFLLEFADELAPLYFITKVEFILYHILISSPYLGNLSFIYTSTSMKKILMISLLLSINPITQFITDYLVILS